MTGRQARTTAFVARSTVDTPLHATPLDHTGATAADAEAALVELHAGLARAVSDRYQDHGIDLTLLRQAAHAGLVQAAADFDPEARVDFVTHALPRVRAAVKSCFREAGGRIDQPLARNRAPVVHHEGVARAD